MPGAGELTNRVRFDQRELDANGLRQGPFVEGFTVWARLIPLRGGEGVIAQRLESSQPYVITVRDSSQTRAITTGFRAFDGRAGLMNITGVTKAKESGFIDILAVAGGARG